MAQFGVEGRAGLADEGVEARDRGAAVGAVPGGGIEGFEGLPELEQEFGGHDGEDSPEARRRKWRAD